jgi:hypothetical protein
MNNDFEVSIEQEVAAVQMERPHVVVLGAGASRATCPRGDANGKLLPLMNDFAKILSLEGLFRSWSIDPNQNFESIFSDLYQRKETQAASGSCRWSRGCSDKDSLIENIWHKHTTATHHSLHNLKDELDEALDDTTLIETITGVGYAFTAPVMRLEPDRTAASGNGLGPKMLPIFPGIGTPAGSLFVHSAADSGKNDHVKYIKRKVKWEARPRQMVLTSEDAPETMVIPFRHTLKKILRISPGGWPFWPSKLIL